MKRDKITLKSYFETGDIPTQSQYENLIDSLRHLDDSVPASQVVFEGYREQNSRPMDLLVELGDFDDSNFGTKLLVNDADQEIIMDGSLVFRSATQGGAVQIQKPTNSGSVNLFLPTVSGNLVTEKSNNIFTATQVFEEAVTFNDNTTFSSPIVSNDAISITGGGINVVGDSSFDHRLDVSGILEAKAGLNVSFPLTSFDVASQASGSIAVANNSNGGEAPTIAGKNNGYSPGLQFIASTRDTTGTLADMIFGVRENDNTDFTAELNTVAFQFRRYSTPLVNIYRNGRQENLFGLDVSGTATFNNSVEFNDALTVTSGGVEVYGASAFEDTLELNGSLNANSGINSQWHIKLKDNAWLWSQYSAAHDELRLNANTAGGWDFYNQTQTDFANIRANGAEFSGLVTANLGINASGQTVTAQEVAIEHQTGYAVLDLKADVNNTGSGGVSQVRYHLGGTQYIRQGINVNGDYELRTGAGGGVLQYKLNQSDSSHEFLSAVRLRGTTSMYGIAETDRRLTFNGNIADIYNIYYYDEGDTTFHTIEIGGSSTVGSGLQVFNNGDITVNGVAKFNYDIEVNQTISTPTDTHLSIVPNGAGNIYIGNGVNGNSMYHYSNLNDGRYTTFTHNTTQSVFDSTHAAGFRFNKGIQVHGDIRTIGNFVSSDGTPGYNGSFTVGTFTITVKDGLITDVVDIS